MKKHDPFPYFPTLTTDKGYSPIPRLTVTELRYRGNVVNHKRVQDMMRQDNLLCLKKRFKPITTDSTHRLPVYANLLKNTKITGLNQAWV